MKYNTELIGKKIKDERLKLGWSQENLGKELGQKSGAKQVSKYEKGMLPPLDVMLQLCDIFHCELGYLLGEEDYALGDRLDTKISNKLGLSLEAIHGIEYITGNGRSCLASGCNYKRYRMVLNKALVSRSFIEFIERLNAMEEATERKKQLPKDLIKKYGEDIYKQALKYHNSTTDYEHDETAEKLPEIYSEAMADINSAEEDDIKTYEKIRYLRFEALEMCRYLVDEIFPEMKEKNLP